MIIWHLKVVEHLNGQNIEPCAAIDEVLVTCTLLMTGEQSIRRTPVSVGNDTYGITRIPTTVAGRGVVRRAGSAVSTSTQVVYLGSSREDA